MVTTQKMAWSSARLTCGSLRQGADGTPSEHRPLPTAALQFDDAGQVDIDSAAVLQAVGADLTSTPHAVPRLIVFAKCRHFPLLPCRPHPGVEDGEARLLVQLPPAPQYEPEHLDVSLTAAAQQGARALHAACQSGNAAVVRKLLEQGGAEIERVVDGMTVVTRAAASGHVDCLALVVDAALAVRGDDKHRSAGWAGLGADADLDMSSESPEVSLRSGGALAYAAANGHSACLELLLKSGAVQMTSDQGAALLHLAAHNGFADVVRALLARKVDVNASAKFLSYTPLIRAAAAGHLDAVRVLVEEGNAAILHQTAGGTGGDSAVYRAAWNGHVDVVRYLAQKGADVNVKENSGGWTPLRIAEYFGHQDVVAVLIAFGATE